MAVVHVYNKGLSPVVYGDGRTIAGLDWANVEQELVQDYIDAGVLKVHSQTSPAPEPVAIEVEETIPADNSESVETDVPFEATVEAAVEDAVEEKVEAQAVDAPPKTPTPATMRKTRRRKTAPPEKE